MYLNKFMNNYFCVLPFYSIENDFSAPDKNIYCCRLPTFTDINEIRLSMANKQRSSKCTSCWKLEDSGLKSERQLHNSTLDYLLDLNLDNIESSSLKNGFNPLVIKLATSNLCNGQCITCNSNLSSSWAALEGKSSQYLGIDLDLLDNKIDWAKIVSISFVGGEPLLEKRNFKILERLIENNNSNCFISIVTNGSIDLNECQTTLLSKFSKLNICLSIDGVEKSFEYLRFPCKWNKLIQNINSFKNLTDNLSVSCMISNLNVYYFKEIMDFFNDYKLGYLCKQINYPTIFAPGNLPPKIKELIRERNKNHVEEMNGFLSMGQYSESLFEKFKLELKRQDDLKNISICNYLPELSNLL